MDEILPHPNLIYSGNRDTEPRSLMVTRINKRGRNLFFCCTQLSTLTEEDKDIKINDNIIKIRKPTFYSIRMREKQIKVIVEYIRSYQKKLGLVEPIIIIGDFNCEPDAKELKSLKKIDISHAHLGSPDDWINSAGWTEAPDPPYTHRERFHHNKDRRILIDHIFVSSNYFSIKKAYIIDLDNIEKNNNTSGVISDHNPVIVQLSLYM